MTEQVDLELLRCPRTGAKLSWRGAGQLVSEEGEYVYPVVYGVPDFRLFDPPYHSREEELEIAKFLVNASIGLDYEQLVRLYVEQYVPLKSKEKELKHRLQLRYRSPGRLHNMKDAVNADIPSGGVVLDIGCGSGEAAGEMLRLGAKSVVGIDISLIELVFAKKLLAQEGMSATLVAGCAESLPFADNCFDMVYSPDVIEHVSDQALYLKEANRVLSSKGYVLLNSPNRYSVVCPEPHVGIWGLTFLPRFLIDPCCRLLGKGPYTGKRLISLVELRKLVVQSFGECFILGRSANPLAESILGKLYYKTRPLSVNLFSYFCSQHIVYGTKSINGDSAN